MFYWQDIKYAFRLLAKSPMFTILTVIVLAGGLGLSIFTFSFLHTAMLKPLPVPDGERVVRLLTTGGASSSGVIDAADLAAIRPDLTVLSDLGAYTGRELIAGTGEGARSIQATATEWNVFRTTRASPLLGRGFRPDDQEPGAEPVVVLSHWAWRVVFGAVIALPLTLLVGWGFSRYFPIALTVSVGTALGVSAAITGLVLAATWLPTRRAIAIEPRDALWRE